MQENFDKEPEVQIENQYHSLSPDLAQNPQKNQKLDKSQKISMVVLAFFAFFVLTVWLIQTRQGLEKGKLGVYMDNQIEQCSGPECLSQQDVDLRQKDTDGDGLSDYDELHIYNTSPYLVDTDGDGISDYDEVMRNSDPNCPEGADCSFDAKKTPTNAFEPLDMGQLPSNTPQDISKQIEYAQEVLSGEINPQGLREYMMAAGMDREVLDQISDEELMSVYQEVLVVE